MPKSTFLELPMTMQPLGLFYLAARLESLGHKCDFYDLNVDDFPEDVYDQFWVSATSPQMSEIKRIGHILSRYMGKSVLGGAAAWANPESCMGLGYDLVVSGESDSPESIKKILDHLVWRYNTEPHLTVSISKGLDWVLPPVRRWSRKYNSALKNLDGDYIPATTMFTSRGCPLECAFCIAEGQAVLMADGTYKNIEDVQVGDMVMGLHEGKTSGYYIAPTKVLDTMNRGVKDIIKIGAGDNHLYCTPDHKIYVNDGHKTRWKRADSSTVGKTQVRLFPWIDERSDDFKRGWLQGYLAGDGCIHKRNHQTQITITSRDTDMLDVIQEWSAGFGFELRRFKHVMGNKIFPTKLDSKYIDGVQITSGIVADNFLSELYNYTDEKEFAAGWLAGMYDSDGTLDSGNDCRIFQSKSVKPYNCELIEYHLEMLGISYSVQVRDGVNRYCLGTTNFLTTCRPMMDRKYPDKFFYKSLPIHSIDDVKDAGQRHTYDLETECHSFIVEGFIVHNCESGRHGVIWDRLTRYEPLDVVEYQIKESKELGYGALCYYDDILPLHKPRTLELMKIHRKYEMIWRCFLRSDIICKQGGYDYLKELRDGGLVEIFVGVESASNEIKNNITKKTTIEQDTKIVEYCKKLGIRCKTSFILGLPGESFETMEETRRWILEHRPDRVQVGRLIPFKGTPLADHPENYDLTYEQMPDDDWFYMGHNESNHSFVSTSHLTVQEIDDFWHSLNKELEEEGIEK